MVATEKNLDLATKAKERAIYNHDMVNIVAMSIIVIMCAQFLFENAIISNIGTRNSIAPTGQDYSQIIFTFFFSYMVLDSTWILVQPTCVASKSPLLILFHHAITVGIISVVYFDAHYTFYMALTLLCESNTVFLSLRRNTKRGTWANTLSEYLFIATWFLFRLFVFPFVTILSFYEWKYRTERFGTIWNMILPGGCFI